MAKRKGIICILFIPSLLKLIHFSQAEEAVICYDCTSWNPYCADSVQNPFPEAVAVVECNITKTCFIRNERDGMISRGCADWWMFSSITSDYLGCQEQVPLWMKPQEWCFCDTDYCNGKSMDDIKQLNGQKQDLHLQETVDQDSASEKNYSSNTEENKVIEQVVHESPEQSTILPWWWWYVHWSTEKTYWLEGDGKQQETTQKWWKDGKVTKLSDLWDVPAVPTSPVGVQGDKHENAEQADRKQNLKDEENEQIDDNRQEDNFEMDFSCWDCSSDNPLCGEIVKTPETYYVGRVTCPITQKCFIRKDKGVIYRGCADGWKDSTIDYFYVGCRNQTMWDGTVEWCFCSSPYCNVQSMDSLRNNYPMSINADDEQVISVFACWKTLIIKGDAICSMSLGFKATDNPTVYKNLNYTEMLLGQDAHNNMDYK